MISSFSWIYCPSLASLSFESLARLKWQVPHTWGSGLDCRAPASGPAHSELFASSLSLPSQWLSNHPSTPFESPSSQPSCSLYWQLVAPSLECPHSDFLSSRARPCTLMRIRVSGASSLPFLRVRTFTSRRAPSLGRCPGSSERYLRPATPTSWSTRPGDGHQTHVLLSTRSLHAPVLSASLGWQSIILTSLRVGSPWTHTLGIGSRGSSSTQLRLTS